MTTRAADLDYIDPDVGYPTSFTLESAFGSVKPAALPTDFDALIRAAKDDKAQRTTNA